MSLHPIPSTGVEIAEAVRAGEVRARDVIEVVLGLIEETQEELNAFTSVTTQRALAEAEAVDRAVAAGRDPGPLAGVPYSVKNLFDLEGVVTVAGSRINRDNAPAAQDATCVERLKAAGAVCLGAVNMGEYAYDFVTLNVHDGATRNPRDPGRSAGGSSGGSGAAVAAGLGSLSIGTDTNGSIRVPSSFCGVWGLKPTYGRLSRAGAFPFVDSLDTIGPLARSVADLALAHDVLVGYDPRDPVCSKGPAGKVFATLDDGMDGIRVGVLGGYFGGGGAAVVHAAVARVAASLGARDCFEFPEASIARAAAYVITTAEGGALHRERLRTRAGDFDPATRDRFLAGAMTPATWYLKAQRFRAWWREQVTEIFRGVDVLLAPATPIAAPCVDQQTLEYAGRELPLRPNIGLFTQPVTLVGLPVVAAPVHQPGELPVAVQLIGAPGSEPVLLRVARELERSGTCAAPVASSAGRGAPAS